MSEMASTLETRTTRVLVVDDDEDVPVVVRLALESKGYSVTLVDNGLKGIKAARESVFDLLIVDLKMPGLSGADTIREIKTFRPNVPIIVITGSLDPIEEGIQDEISLCVYKPFRVSELRAAVEKALGEQRQALDEPRKQHSDGEHRVE